MSRIAFVLAVVLCAVLLGACSSGSRSEGNPPSITSFTATPALIPPGGSALLSWTATDADSASLSPDVGAVTGTSHPVSPGATTTYTLTVSNARGTDTAQAVVIVQPAQCVEGLACTPEIPCHLGRVACGSGDGVCTDTGALAAEGTACGTGMVCRAGTCILACASDVTCVASACVRGVTSCPAAAGEPVCRPVANAPDGTSCGTGKVCSGGACVALLCSAGERCQPANPCESGTVACTSPALPGTCVPGATLLDGTPCGVGLACLSGVCAGPPTIRSFTASPDDVGPGGSCTLAWDVAGATTLVIDQGIGLVTGTSRTVSPSATTTYTLTASNAIGSAQRSATVTYSTIVTVAMPGPFSIEVGTSIVLTPRVTVTGNPSIEMSWSLGTGSLGTVSPARGEATLYTAPSQPGVYRVYATSVWDPTKWDHAVIAVIPAPAPDTWRPRASLSTPRTGHTATLLTSGKVLVAGGASTPSAEVYDPETGTWQSTSPMTRYYGGHAAALLPSGRVLVVGPTSAEIYDPATNAWTVAGPMNAVHYWPTATVLATGQVLVLGMRGPEPRDPTPGVAEIFDPASGEFTLTDELPRDRRGLSATALTSGMVLVAGGNDREELLTNSATLFDPAAPPGSRWAETGHLTWNRFVHTATRLPSGNVLVAGGLVGATYFPTASAEIYEAGSGAWVSAGHLSTPRTAHTATLLASGRVLFAGGSCSPGIEMECDSAWLASAEYFEAATDSWVVVAPMAQARGDHTATLLPNGSVLVVGGTLDWGVSSASVEEYTP